MTYDNGLDNSIALEETAANSLKESFDTSRNAPLNKEIEIYSDSFGRLENAQPLSCSTLSSEIPRAPQPPQREILIPPNGAKRVLLHSCCAPCSGEVMEALHTSGIELEIFFYNPNIHPRKEYELRKNDNIRYAEKMGIPFVDADYDTDNWFSRVKGLEWEPEKGIRCTACFDMRFERTALYAKENNFSVFTSCLGISRWKRMDQINGSGERAARRYPGLSYWTFNWRKKGGGDRMYEIAKRENFYKQEYCGCVYSLRDTNQSRKKRGLRSIEIGTEIYSAEGVAAVNCASESLPLMNSTSAQISCK